LAAKTPAAAGLENKLKSFLEMKETELPPEFRPTLRTLKKQIRTYLAGDTSMMFDSPELHMIQTYLAGKRQALDGTTIEGKFEFIELLCKKSLETQKRLTETVGTEFTNNHT
jgi:fumarate reductase flavoprotein subunit